jgi:hypothetical protein
MSALPAVGFIVAAVVTCIAIQSAAVVGQGAAPAPKVDTAAVGQQAAPAAKVERAVEVSVQYSLRLPLKARGDVNEQRDVMEQGRRLLYQLAARECALLSPAIGQGCELANLHVQAQAARGDVAMTVSGNAQFKLGAR